MAHRALIVLCVAIVACGDAGSGVDGGTMGDGGGAGTDAPSTPADGGGPVTDAGAATDGGTPLPDGGPPVASGCGRAPAAEGARTLEVSGQGERSYLVELPSGYDETTPWPVVFGFHGATTSGMTFASRFYGNLASTMGDAAILVYPDAQGMPTAWDNAHDVPFFDALLAQVENDYCVDEARVFATGHSSGGFFSNELGCRRGDVLRAIAPVSGGGPFGGPGCVGEVAVLLAHGTADDIVLLSFGEGSRDRWADENGCDTGSSSDVSPSPCVAYTCTGEPVRWCEYSGMHEWPSFAPEAIWTFFSSL